MKKIIKNTIFIGLFLMMILVFCGNVLARDDSASILNERILGYSGKQSASVIRSLRNTVENYNQEDAKYRAGSIIKIYYNDHLVSDKTLDSLSDAHRYYVGVHIDNTYEIVDYINIYEDSYLKTYLTNISGKYELQGDKVNEIYSSIKSQISRFTFNGKEIEKDDFEYVFEFIDEKTMYDIGITVLDKDEVTIEITGKIKERPIYDGLYNADYKHIINKYFDQIKLYYNNTILTDDLCEKNREKIAGKFSAQLSVKIVKNSDGDIVELHAIDNPKMLDAPWIIIALLVLETILIVLFIKNKGSHNKIIIILIVLTIIALVAVCGMHMIPDSSELNENIITIIF